MEMLTILIVFLIGFFSSFIGNFAGGGGGLIAIPALIFLGLPIEMTIGTRKFSSLGSNLITFFQFKKSNKVSWKNSLIISCFTVFATIIGVNILVEINKDFLMKILGLVLLITIPLTFFKKSFGLKKKETTKTKVVLGHIFYFFTDIIDAFIGAGAGFFTNIILIYFMGLTYIQANATKKLPALIMSIVGRFYVWVLWFN